MIENGRVAVVIGVTGKRDLHAKDEAVRGALREALAELDMTAIAGALRFIADKLSWEAEVNGYEEILDRFQRAQVELAALAGEAPASGSDAARASIILELGKEALDESETWIRRHRERPLEPLVGA